VLNKEKALPRAAWQGFFFVDKWFEISNQILIRDMAKIIQVEEIIKIIT
jgi:phage antirepressor YoqD-like protein